MNLFLIILINIFIIIACLILVNILNLILSIKFKISRRKQKDNTALTQEDIEYLTNGLNLKDENSVTCEKTALEKDIDISYEDIIKILTSCTDVSLKKNNIPYTENYCKDLLYLNLKKIEKSNKFSNPNFYHSYKLSKPVSRLTSYNYKKPINYKRGAKQ